jgi:arginyl-tRNA--protein-N-Asp/Glu arginylyltransferase
MAYKAQFGPHELLIGGAWQRADAAAAIAKPES